MNDIVQVSQEIIESFDVLKKDLDRFQIAFQKFLSTVLPEEEPSENEIKVIEEAERDLAKGEYVHLKEFLKELK